MDNLFRVISKQDLEAAQTTGKVPRCNADRRANHIHLNEKEAVETVANRYFEAMENPVVLEIDVSSFKEKLIWKAPTAEKPWKQPCAIIDNIAYSNVVKVHQLLPTEREGKIFFRLAV